MITVLLTMSLIALLMTAMSIGLLVKGRVLRGSCGGVQSNCFCDNPSRACARRLQAQDQYRA